MEFTPIINFIKNKYLSDRTRFDESFRMFHGRGGLFPELEHIVVDWHPSIAVISLFKEYSDKNINYLKDELESLLKNYGLSCIFLQRRYEKSGRYEVIYGEKPECTFAIENGLKYELNFDSNQNSGLFLDMKKGRDLVRSISQNKRVLNLFSYTCGFSVVAKDGMASEVINLDMSKKSLSTGRKNHSLNSISCNSVQFLAHDLFKSWGKIKRKGPYDIIIIDPPTNQGKSFNVVNGYEKIVKRLPELLSNSADIVACLNSPHMKSKFLIDLFEEHYPDCELKEVIYSADEFLENDDECGLKICHFIKSDSL